MPPHTVLSEQNHDIPTCQQHTFCCITSASVHFLLSWTRRKSELEALELQACLPSLPCFLPPFRLPSLPPFLPLPCPPSEYLRHLPQGLAVCSLGEYVSINTKKQSAPCRPASPLALPLSVSRRRASDPFWPFTFHGSTSLCFSFHTLMRTGAIQTCPLQPGSNICKHSPKIFSPCLPCTFPIHLHSHIQGESPISPKFLFLSVCHSCCVRLGPHLPLLNCWSHHIPAILLPAWTHSHHPRHPSLCRKSGLSKMWIWWSSLLVPAIWWVHSPERLLQQAPNRARCCLHLVILNYWLN